MRLIWKCDGALLLAWQLLLLGSIFFPGDCAAMRSQPENPPELQREAEQAQQETDFVMGLGEAILQRAREMIHRMKDRFRTVMDECDGAREEVRK